MSNLINDAWRTLGMLEGDAPPMLPVPPSPLPVPTVPAVTPVPSPALPVPSPALLADLLSPTVGNAAYSSMRRCSSGLTYRITRINGVIAGQEILPVNTARLAFMITPFPPIIEAILPTGGDLTGPGFQYAQGDGAAFTFDKLGPVVQAAWFAVNGGADIQILETLIQQ